MPELSSKDTVPSTEQGRKASSKSASGRKAHQPSQTELKDLQRCHKALERQILQAEKGRTDHGDHAASSRSGSPGQEEEEDLDLSRALSPEEPDPQPEIPPRPDQASEDPFACPVAPQDPPSAPPAHRSNSMGLQDLPETVQQLISRAISHGIATGIREHRSASAVSESLHSWRSRLSPSASLTGSPERSPEQSPSQLRGSVDLCLEDEPQRDTDLSDDEGALPDVPAFTGLFPQGLFKSLLHFQVSAPPTGRSQC